MSTSEGKLPVSETKWPDSGQEGQRSFVTMSAEDSDCSIGVSDFEEEDDDGVAVVQTSLDSDSSEDDTEDSSVGFFSDDDQVDENWNSRQGGGKGSADSVTYDNDWVIEGKCALCHNLEHVNEDDLEERCQSPSAESWCKCGKCRVVSYHMKKYDRVCCHELAGVNDVIQSDAEDQGHSVRVNDPDHQYPDHKCITLHPKFTSDVLQYGALYRSSDHLDHREGQSAKTVRHRDERERAHRASCSFIRWIWSRLGYGHRVMPPACVVARIREVHMPSAPFWYYQNFNPGKFRCEVGRHCVAAQEVHIK